MQLRRERVAAPGLLHVRVELLLPRSSSCSRGLGRVEPCLRAPLQDVVHLDVVDAGWCHSARCILLDDLPFRKRIGIGLDWCLLLLRRGGANLRTVPPRVPILERIWAAGICGSAHATHHHQQGKQREHPRRKHAGYTKCLSLAVGSGCLTPELRVVSAISPEGEFGLTPSATSDATADPSPLALAAPPPPPATRGRRGRCKAKCRCTGRWFRLSRGTSSSPQSSQLVCRDQYYAY